MQLPATSTGFQIWAWVPVMLLSGLLSIQIAMFFISTGDPSFSVEPDYYAKAVRWDEERAQSQRGLALGYQVTASVSEPSRTSLDSRLLIQITRGDGRPLVGATVTAVAFHNARASERKQLVLSEVKHGTYEAQFPVLKSGIWELRTTVRCDEGPFTTVHELDLVAPKVAQQPAQNPSNIK